MSDSEKKQTLKGLDGVSDCRKEYEEADWEEYQIEKQIAEHQARVQAEELEYLEYQLYLQENNLDPEYLDYLASKAESPLPRIFSMAMMVGMMSGVMNNCFGT